MPTLPKTFLTEEQYLEIERTAERKSEYFNGEMFAMAGASIQHVAINDNLVGILLRVLAGSGCRSYSRDLRLRISSTGMYTYPDMVVICGKIQLSETDKNTVTNPTVIVEILSPSTQNYDRGDKFAHYRAIPSLREYVMIAQDRIHLERFTLQEDGAWLFRETSDAESVVAIESIGVNFPLGEVYSGVEFEAA
jgi:Uma2 family endonuclease